MSVAEVVGPEHIAVSIECDKRARHQHAGAGGVALMHRVAAELSLPIHVSRRQVQPASVVGEAGHGDHVAVEL